MANYTAGILIIGDEILSGKTKETNSYFLSKQLHALGISVRKIVVVPDDTNAIAKEVVTLSKSFNIVFTCGGIGPTHDDVTYVGIAKGFNESLVLNKDMAEVLSKYYPGSNTDVIANPALKMAQIPESSKLVYKSQNEKCKKQLTFMDMPTVCVSNIYIFPGTPTYLQSIFLGLKHLFRNPYNTVFYSRHLYVNRGEVEIIPSLNRAVDTFKDVIFGSYPIEACTKITMESIIEEKVSSAETFLRKELSANTIVIQAREPLYNAAASVYHVAETSRNEKLTQAVRKSLKVCSSNIIKRADQKVKTICV